MPVEYNSMLIAKLYASSEDDDVIEVLDEIGKIGDPIFVYPVYQAYKNNKTKYISHYFILALSKLNSSDVIKIAFEIGENQETSTTDIVYVLDILCDKKVYEPRAVKIALSSLSLFINNFDDNEYHLYSIISLLKNAGLLNQIEKDLLLIFNNKRFNKKSRAYVFGKWLEMEPKKNLQVVIDDFEEIKEDSEKEILIAKVISTWTGTKIEELKKIIEENGGAQARLIIKKSREEDAEKNKKANIEKQQIVQKSYSNADLVEEIYSLKSKINIATTSNGLIGFSIFPPNGELILQLKAANDNATLMKACIDLREVIQNLDGRLENHGLGIDEIKKLLPDTAEEHFNKSINKLFLFLCAKKIQVDSGLFGLRQLNQLAGLLGAHPTSEKDNLIEKLKIAKLDKAYNEEDWTMIHRSLLKQYVAALSGIFEAIK